MLIGDLNDFAIEVVVEPDLKVPSAVWGQMCLRIGNTTLGDFDDHYCALFPAYKHFEWHANHDDRLWDDAFDDMSPEDIYDMVHHAIYGDDDRTMDEIKRDSLRFGIFDFLTNWGEQFDGYSSVIISPDSDTMMILHRPYLYAYSPRRLADDFVMLRCTRSGYINVSRRFVDWFEMEADRLSPKKA
jgi:hypothetical protein